MARYDIYGNPVTSTGTGGGTTSKPFDGKTCVYIGDSVCCFDKNTGGTGAIPDYMAQYYGGTWKNFCIGGTSMGAYRLTDSPYCDFTLGAIADAINSGDFTAQETSANSSGFSAGSTSYKANQKVADMKVLSWSSVDTLFIHFGTNDVAYGNQIGTADDTPSKDGTMCASLKYAIDKILSAYPTMKIIVCGMIWRYADSAMASALIPKNAILKECCAKIGIPFVDLLAEMGVDNSNRTSFLYDGTHPNANGKIRYVETMGKHF